VLLGVHALADRKAFTPQDVPSLCVALDLMSAPARRRTFSSGSELPAVTQGLDVAGGIGDRSRAGVTDGVELVGLDLDASVRVFTLHRDRLEASLGKLRRQRLFLHARHWSAMCGPPDSAAHHTGAEHPRSMVSEPAVDTNAAQHHVFSFPPQLVSMRLVSLRRRGT
jgi:hypothetical protein